MSRKRADVPISVDEFVASLKRSLIPTVIVEGGDDIVVYRYIEKHFGPLEISILPVGGRDAVLAIFQRTAEIGHHVYHIADRDIWCMTDVPPEFVSPNFSFTHGYSIENDVIIDGDVLGLLTEQELNRFRQELDLFLEWYALALHRHLGANSEVLSLHPNEILENESRRVELVALRPDEEYPADCREQLSRDPLRLIRGKSLFPLLLRQLSYPGRIPKHHHLSLMEVIAASPGQHLASIFDRVKEYFRLEEPGSADQQMSR